MPHPPFPRPPLAAETLLSSQQKCPKMRPLRRRGRLSHVNALWVVVNSTASGIGRRILHNHTAWARHVRREAIAGTPDSDSGLTLWMTLCYGRSDSEAKNFFTILQLSSTEGDAERLPNGELPCLRSPVSSRMHSLPGIPRGHALFLCDLVISVVVLSVGPGQNTADEKGLRYCCVIG